VLSLFFVRIRGKDTDTFRAWGYPWAPAIFVAACAVIVVNEIVRTPGPSAAGLSIIASGIPVYWWLRRK